ncbi:ATP-binding protein [Lewinella sp. IMCC34191]|uniref:ATP-binding protein n=1 Tax=Lewinella sp. IMCC34191 TaxID=2259172 RepID=UPI0018E57F14|nr:ATP-binding protein [Lewinella sp. IMCC34191]
MHTVHASRKDRLVTISPGSKTEARVGKFSHRSAWLWILLIQLHSPLFAQETYTLDPQYPVHPLDDYLEILPSPEGNLTTHQLIQDTTLPWFPLRELEGWADYDQVYYARLYLRVTDTLAGWQLQLEDRLFDDTAWIRGNGRVDVWAMLGNRLLWHRVTGADLAPSQRDLTGRRQYDRVRLDSPADTLIQLYLRIEGNSYGIFPFFNVVARASGFQEYQPYLPVGNFFNTFLFGVTFIILVYHLLLFAFLGEPVYGWYSLWLLFCTLTQGMTIGLEPAFWLGLNGTDGRLILWLIIPNGMLFTFWLFGRAFLESKRLYPNLDKLILTQPLLMVLVIVGGIVYLQVARPNVFMTIFGWHYEALGLFAVCGIGIAIALLIKPKPLAKIFGAGAVLGCATILVGVLWSLRLIRVPIDPYALSIILQILVYSLGLAYRRYRQRIEQRAAELLALSDRNEVARMKDLEEVKARFFANVSHEFRTPLTLISGPLEMACDRRESEPRNGPVALSGREVEIMHSGVDRLRKLVEQLLSLSRLESGMVFLKLRRGGLVGYVRKLALSFSSLAEQNNVSLDTCFPDERQDAFYDADKLETVFVNLLANAIKYAPERGRVSVRMSIEAEYYIIEVTDDGPGIPAADLGLIFDRFYRVEGTGEEGSGIGLALTKELVDAYGGTISVRSEVGKGTTFRLRLPFALAKLPQSVMAAEFESGSPVTKTVTPGPLPTHRKVQPPGEVLRHDTMVLIVEDSEDLRDFIGSTLFDAHRILYASDGDAGERMALEHLPDLIVSDIMMPGKDGYALCHSLKRNPKTSHIPIILLTAKAGQDSTIAGLNLGADDYLTKPFNPKELRLRVKNLLDARERLWKHFTKLDLSLLPDFDRRSIEDQFVQQVVGYIKEHLAEESLSVDFLSRQVGYSRSQLTRKLKALTGKTPNKLINEMRLHEAFRLLEKRAGTVSEIAYAVGYTNLSYFAKNFRGHFGSLPSEVLETSGQ